MKEEILKPPKGVTINIAELIRYRELFYFFTWRDIKVKYKQTLLGFLWAILQPFLMMVVFSVFFNQMLGVPSDDIPYPIFSFAGLMIWNIFAAGLTGAGNSMVTNANIIKKIYFPRLIIPISAILVALFDFLMSFVVYIGILIFYNYDVNILQMTLYIPLSILITIVSTFGLGSLLAALNVKYRDFRYVIPFSVQLLFFVSPVIYPISVVDIHWLKVLLNLNPMAAAINLSRASVTAVPVEWNFVLLGCGVAILLFMAGLYVFKRTESQFADIA